jgi:uncharacterized protein YbjT (DUF2867 family)
MDAAPHSDLKRVLLAGATGLVGQQALRQLLVDPQVGEVRVLVRRPLRPQDLLADADVLPGLDKLRICVADFEHLAEHADWLAVDWVLCALGTTIKKAGSQQAFRRVDLDYPLQLAQLAKAQGASQFLLVSALGASAQSGVFYNRVKGELEDAIRGLDFDSVTVAQPSLLAGERAEFRLGEHVALWLDKLVGWLVPERYKPVRVEQVAAGLLASARVGRPGWHVLSNTALRSMR